MNTRFIPSLWEALPAATPVIWCFKEGRSAVLATEVRATPPARRLEAWMAAGRFDGAEGRMSLVPLWLDDRHPSQVIVAGLGERSEWKTWKLERAAAAAARFARKSGLPALAFCAGIGGLDEPVADHARRVVRGAVTGAYRFDRYQSAEPQDEELKQILLAGPRSDRAAILEAARAAAAEGVTLNRVQDLANLPANELNPVTLAGQVRRLARTYGLKCEVWDEKKLAREKCAGLLAVGQGSRTPPRLIRLSHPGTRRGAAPVVLIGKAITFDSGGISLKPGKGMEWMKFDKSGAMAALAATLLAAQAGLPHPVVTYLAVAENMPGGKAQRPGDIIRYRNGKTVEVINTDAEGRLVLADALVLAAGDRPRAVVDLATLTGAVIIALGHHASAVMGTDEALLRDLQNAGEASGERLWPLPLWAEYEHEVRSAVADLKNVGDGSAGTIAGAAFLKAFAPHGVPWAHVDIAGTAWQEKETPCRASGATLFGARLLSTWLNRM